MSSNAVAAFVIIMGVVWSAGWWAHRLSKIKAALISGNQEQSAREIELLSSENADLKGQLGRLEERLAVLERIATDPAERTAREIESLR